MDAMILAAGLGTRLRPLTDHTPKALVPVGGVPMLERIARRLMDAGADRLIINTHHLGEQIERYAAEAGWPAEVRISPEPEQALETGGALVAAESHFRRRGPFFLHNADILTDLPLEALHAAHVFEGDPLATVAVMDRPTSRKLLFDLEGLLGRVDERNGIDLRVREPVGPVVALPFAGVHVISPRIFGMLSETGAFSILDPYLRLAAAGERILPFRVDGCLWLDIGRPEQLEQANRVASGVSP
jgi:NDP-sugar pyrophosphorylase family protein